MRVCVCTCQRARPSERVSRSNQIKNPREMEFYASLLRRLLRAARKVLLPCCQLFSFKMRDAWPGIVNMGASSSRAPTGHGGPCRSRLLGVFLLALLVLIFSGGVATHVS